MQLQSDSGGSPDPQQLAKRARLRYVVDDIPGLSRRRCGKGFCYLFPSGRVARRGPTRQRIERLAIPPAWQEVWICPYANGHLQATGRDDRHRKQYIYHEKWHEVTSLVKFSRLIDIGTLLPRVRRRVRKDLLDNEPLSHTHTLATMVALLDASAVRIGNEEYTQKNGSYGLSTLRHEHIDIHGPHIHLHFSGKSGQYRNMQLENELLAEHLRHYLRPKTDRMFVHQGNDNRWHATDAADVNDYLDGISGGVITAKDLRTWKASALVAERLYLQADVPTKKDRNKIVLASLDEAAELLGNTRAVCRQHYVHPALVKSYLDGQLSAACENVRTRRRKWEAREEQIAMQLLRALPRA